MSPSVGAESSFARPESADKAAIDRLMQEAVEVSRRLAEAYPDRADALCVMAMAYHRFGQMSRAASWFQKSLQLDPGCAEAYHGIGWIAFRKGDFDEAVPPLRKALELDPSLTNASEQLAQTLTALGKPNEAVAVLDTAIGISGPTWELLYWLGGAYEDSDRYGDAKQEYVAAIELAPSVPDTYYRLSRVCKKLGQGEEARAHLKKFKQLRDSDTERRMAKSQAINDVVVMRYALADVYTAAGQVYYGHGNPRLAETHWLKAAGIAPEDTVSRMELARLYQQSGGMEKTLQMLTELAGIEPENAAHQMSIGAVNAGLDRFDEAADAFKRVCELAPGHPDGYHALAKLYLLSNRETAEARKLAQTAVDLAPIGANCVLLSAACNKNGDRRGALAAIERAIRAEPGNDEYRRIRETLKEPVK